MTIPRRFASGQFGTDVLADNIVTVKAAGIQVN